MQSVPSPKQPASGYPSRSRSQAVYVHAAAAFEQRSVVQTCASLQLTAVPPWQVPGTVVEELHVSRPLQN